MTANRCLYNHELLILFTSQSPYQSYREDVGDAQATGFVEELAGTAVDTLMCCPQAWMTPLWPSAIDPKWRDEAPGQTEPPAEADRTYFEKAYWRMRRYMLQGKDPVALSLAAARRIGIDFFLSYRMNEIHYVRYPDCPTHSRFWREHPEWRLHPGPAGAPLNYLVPEVRARYLAILAELAERYDLDGLELDFMRHPTLFPSGREAEGIPVLTGFVRAVRAMLDRVGAARGRRLPLGVRVPRSPALALAAGMDVPAWDREGLVDMVNASPHFRHILGVDIAGYKAALRHARVYGEMHFNTRAGATPNGYCNNINRRTTPRLYETAALHFLDQGADGLSFFNFAYTRDHSFAEPRRRGYPGVEPPFAVLRSILDEDHLRRQPKHYFLGPDLGELPIRLSSPSPAREVTLPVADRLGEGDFAEAVLRLEADSPIQVFDFAVTLNGRELVPIPGSGELFRPFSTEALPPPENLRFYAVPLDALRHGANRVAVANRTCGEYALGQAVITGLELALYRHPVP
ncbi:MAG: hypothetical protein RBU25_00205 [Lentisphaeria bacterium]|jgi:hypothetical protein|nr:hypothetical protein [Lentisphaeria bacterium]